MFSFAEGQQLVREMFVVGNIEATPVATMIELLETADDLYFNDQDTFMTDDQYDVLKQLAQRLSPAHKYFTGVGSAVRGGKIKLPHQMGSLNQVQIGEFTDWVNDLSLGDEEIVISDKLDGASAMLVYDASGGLQIAYSRGDGVQGADITRHVLRIKTVPHQITNETGAPVSIRAENIISKESFALINTGHYTRGGRIYKNPRNMVSGLMNSSDNQDKVYTAIDTVAYEIIGSTLSKWEQLQQLERWGFRVARFNVAPASSYDDNKLSKLLVSRRESSMYEIDGVVVDVNSAAIRARLKTDDLNPKYAIKYKVADDSNLAIARVRNVEWNISKDGYQKPRVQIDPVDLVGVTIQNATGFNAKFIKDNKIGPGALVKITRSGDVIPFILEVVQPADEAQMPDGDNVWSDTGVDLILADATSNDTVRFQQLNDFFATIDVPHLGEGNLRLMFDMGFDTPEKIIPLTQEDIGSLVGSIAIGKKIFTSMRTKFTKIPMHLLMGAHPAFGRGVGVRKMKKLEEAFDGDMSMCVDIDKIVAVEGFDVKTAKKIVQGYPIFTTFLQSISQYVEVAPYVKRAQGLLTGKDIVITGFRDKTLDARIESLGGRVASGVSNKTHVVVAADPSEVSTKLTKARQLGIPIVSKADFIKTLQ